MQTSSEWRKFIVNHYSKPDNKLDKIDDTFIKIFQDSNLCVDKFEIGIKINKDLIEKIAFNGVGCAISVSSLDIMINEIKTKSIKEAKNIINNYFDMLNQKQHNEKLLGNLIAYQNVYKQPNRIKCATIGIEGILKLLNKGQKE